MTSTNAIVTKVQQAKAKVDAANDVMDDAIEAWQADPTQATLDAVARAAAIASYRLSRYTALRVLLVSRMREEAEDQA